MIKLFISIIVIVLLVIQTSAQNCNCTESFDWMVKTIEQNDAGFKYVVDKKGIDNYNKFTSEIRKKTEGEKSQTACRKIMENWLLYFREGHLAVRIKNTNEDKILPNDSIVQQQYKNEKTIDLTEKQLIDILEKKEERNPIEGIWYYNNNNNTYTLGIIRNEKSDKKFTAFIIKADSAYWLPKQVKAELTLNDDNKTYSVDFKMRDHSLQKFQLKFGNESNNIFYLIDNYWTRLYPENNLTINEKLLISFNNSKIPFIQQLNDKTLYLRIPSFYYNQKRYIDSILFKYDSLLKSTPNLIIDIRNGTGGSSHSWEKIIPYLYTNPIRLANNLYKASELNAKEYDNYAKDFKDSIISTRCHLTAIRMREHIGELISLSDSKYVNFTLEKVYPYPHNVGIICNKANASADEGFLTYAIQSKKVKLFGTTTAGMIDIANMKTIDFPDGNFVLYYGMTISTSAHENPIEGIGFQPDYFIDSSIDENDRIEYTKSILEH